MQNKLYYIIGEAYLQLTTAMPLIPDTKVLRRNINIHSKQVDYATYAFNKEHDKGMSADEPYAKLWHALS